MWARPFYEHRESGCVCGGVSWHASRAAGALRWGQTMGSWDEMQDVGCLPSARFLPHWVRSMSRDCVKLCRHRVRVAPAPSRPLRGRTGGSLQASTTHTSGFASEPRLEILHQPTTSPALLGDMRRSGFSTATLTRRRLQNHASTTKLAAGRCA
ncbi:hypothetical protein BC628DRAFT_64530 [Trametes gibbosa]|nr:hypothetical protein BC628DRAFT_64530 [Trametes gibbosa]